MPNPSSKTEQLGIRLPKELLHWLRESAKKSGRGIGMEVRNRLLWSFVLNVNSAVDAPVEGAIWVRAWLDQSKPQ